MRPVPLVMPRIRGMACDTYHRSNAHTRHANTTTLQKHVWLRLWDTRCATILCGLLRLPCPHHDALPPCSIPRPVPHCRPCHASAARTLTGPSPPSVSVPSGGLPIQMLNPLYDLTPAANITAVVTEIGMIPPSSVPTVLGRLGAQGQGQ